MINIIVENYILIGERKNPWLADNFRFYVTIYRLSNEFFIFFSLYVHWIRVGNHRMGYM